MNMQKNKRTYKKVTQLGDEVDSVLQFFIKKICYIQDQFVIANN